MCSILHKKKFKLQPSVSKIMASMFLDKEGILLVDFLGKDTTINSEWYKETFNCDNTYVEFVLTKTLKASISFKTMPSLTTACAQMRQSQKWAGLFFPILFTAHIWHLQLHLFSPVKDALCGHDFADDNELKHSFRDVLQSKGREFYITGVQRLTQCWQRCTENDEDFVEK
jgi:hypothetical protein